MGLGGKKLWREHATATAEVLNEISPDFIRVRTLTVKPGMPLWDEVQTSNFIRATDEGINEEDKLLMEHLNCHSSYVSDHVTNLLQEIEGQLPQDKERMLAVIDRFQALSPEERANFRLGRRLGVYNQLGDLNNLHRRHIVDQALPEFRQDGNAIDEEKVYALMEKFI